MARRSESEWSDRAADRFEDLYEPRRGGSVPRLRRDDFASYEDEYELRLDDGRYDPPVARRPAPMIDDEQDVQERLHELAILIEDAKAMPLSASCLVNRAQVLDLIEEIRQMLPAAVMQADQVIADREAVVAAGRRDAERMIERARNEAARMVSDHEVYLAAVAEAQALRADVAEEAQRMREETDDYIDARLATFEITLTKTLQAVDRGRQRLRTQAYDELPQGQDVDFEGVFYDDRR